MSHLVIDEGRTWTVLDRPITAQQAAVITGILHRADIPVLVSVGPDGVVQLWPERALTTLEEVQAFRAITAVTDSRIAWAERRPA